MSDIGITFHISDTCKFRSIMGLYNMLLMAANIDITRY